MRYPPSHTQEAEVNLTPLLDVVFVVLIMFIVVVPILQLDQVALAPGEGEAKTVTNTSPVTIHVRADNSVWMGKRKVALSHLRELFEAAYRTYPEARVQLFHDKSAPFGTYQAIKSAAESAGYGEMDVILEPA